jgi:hypothetical protein
MARCGRCGLFAQYPEDHHEKKWAGTCTWYQMQLTDDEVWVSRECKDFFEKIPGLHIMDHFDYKLKRDNLGDAYDIAKRSKRIAIIALSMALIEFAWQVIDYLR